MEGGADATDVWSVTVDDRWLVSDAGSSGGLDDGWMISTLPIGPESVELRRTDPDA